MVLPEGAGAGRVYRMRVLIVDDVAAVREGLRLLLGDEPDMEVVGEARDGEEAVSLLDSLLPDVVLMDIEMPGGGGLAATRQIKARPRPPAVVVMSVTAEDVMGDSARGAGADGFVEKSRYLMEVITALRAVVPPPGAAPAPPAAL